MPKSSIVSRVMDGLPQNGRAVPRKIPIDHSIAKVLLKLGGFSPGANQGLLNIFRSTLLVSILYFLFRLWSLY
jgi:hypothetical protein